MCDEDIEWGQQRRAEHRGSALCSTSLSHLDGGCGLDPLRERAVQVGACKAQRVFREVELLAAPRLLSSVARRC